MNKKLSQVTLGLTIFLLSALSLMAAEPHVLHSHTHAIVAKLTPSGSLPADTRLNLIIGLPLRNPAIFGALLHDLYDPASGNFHHYLTPDQLNAQFGPTDGDYQAVVNFAKANNLRVDHSYDNRLMVDVSGSVSDIEKAFHVTMRTYQHPTEARTFYAPESEAWVDASLPILDVSGLDNFTGKHPLVHRKPEGDNGKPAGGTGPGGLFAGYDFRTAYASDVGATGTGQSIGLVEMEGYYASDIQTYETTNGLPTVSITNVLLDNVTPQNFIDPTDTNGNLECSVDIELAISMAPVQIISWAT